MLDSGKSSWYNSYIMMVLKKGETKMASGKKTNGKTQIEIVVELLSSGSKVSPININAAVGNKYAAKYISLLRKEGYDIVSIKEGRTVVAYQMTSAPTSVDEEETDAVEVEETEEASVEDASDEEAEVAETSFAVAEDFDEVTDEELEKLVA